jgi:hypothetical protein
VNDNLIAESTETTENRNGGEQREKRGGRETLLRLLKITKDFFGF